MYIYLVLQTHKLPAMHLQRAARKILQVAGFKYLYTTLRIYRIVTRYLGCL